MYLSTEQEQEFLTAISPIVWRLLPQGTEVNLLLVLPDGQISLMGMTPDVDLAGRLEAAAAWLRSGGKPHQTVSVSTKTD